MQPEFHEFVCGMTGSGKSYHTQAEAKRWPGPVLFYNPQAQKMDLGEWTRVTPQDSLSDLISLLRRGRARVSFEPHWNEDIARKQLRAIVDRVMQMHWTPFILIIVDECDQVAPEGKRGTPAHQIAQRGRKQGVWGKFVTQHPSIVSKTIVRQCIRKTIFPTEDSAAYFNKYRWPGERIEAVLSSAPDFHFVVWERGKLTGPFKD